MIYEEVLEKLTSKNFFSSFAGLYRMREIMNHFDNPEETLLCIHVAGTNGKGSVCCMLSEIIKESGYCVGLFTSPYLHDFRERIQVNGEMISKEDLTTLGQQVLSYTDRMFEPPNQFELITIIALLYFRQMHCDIVVLETGLGGTFDPTNIVPHPLLEIITNIGYDHCAVLGNSLEKIALAKAGIIKPNSTVIVYPSVKEATDVITAYALKQDAVIRYLEPTDIEEAHFDGVKECFEYHGLSVRCNLVGNHQRLNCCLVLEAIRILNQTNYFFSDADITRALEQVSWPGRLERMQAKPLVYLDGGHNPQCMQALRNFVIEHYSDRKIYVMAGILRDKDYRAMLTILRPIAERFFFVPIAHPRALSEEEYLALCEEFKLKPVDSLTETLGHLLKTIRKKDVVLLTGSLYLYDTFHNYFTAEEANS